MVAMPNIDHETFTGRFNDAILYRGVSPGTLAKLAHYKGKTTIYRYMEGDVTVPQLEVVYRLADALGCDRLWLMFGRGEPNWDPDWKHPKLG